ncbi:hypothetical protein PIROE2DRAFT_45167, partial [Piromyces sp. E2]
IFRTLQYTFKFILALNIIYNGSEETIACLRTIVRNIQISRQFVRLGRPLEHMYSFYKSLNLKEDLSKYCILGRNLAYAIYLTFDTIVWIHKSGIMKFENMKTISINSQFFWLIGITFGIIHEIYILSRIMGKVSEMKDVFSSKEEKEKEKEIEVRKRRSDDFRIILDERNNHCLILIQHSCDFLQPISYLGIYRIEPIFLALFGIISSLIGARTQWIKVNGK